MYSITTEVKEIKDLFDCKWAKNERRRWAFIEKGNNPFRGEVLYRRRVKENGRGVPPYIRNVVGVDIAYARLRRGRRKLG